MSVFKMSARGKNFTEREKYKLLKLVHKFRDVLENRCINAATTAKKNEAWEAITQEFNNNAVVPRNKKQLNNAYWNLRRHKKQFVQQCLDNINYDLSDSEAGPSDETTLESNVHNKLTELGSVLKQLRKDEMVDKKGMATGDGGGLYEPVFGTLGAQILSISGDQVDPLSNTCDSASSYYNNDVDVTHLEVIPDDSNVTDALSRSFTPPITNAPQDKHNIKIPMKMLNKKIVPTSNTFLKKKYYETKVECANIEKKNKLLEYRLNLKRHKLLDLEMKLKQIEYEKMVQK